jgi:SWI/SNF-related matrix-associated actin-dependent regulator 1 of chromatin subfamily A
MLVCDEVHYIKNKKAKRTEAVEKLGYKVKFVVGITGTPVANSPMEVFTIANLVRPQMFDYTNFNYRYCGGEAERCRTAYNANELNTILKDTIMIRRLKADVLKELPKKRHIKVELDVDLTRYQQIINEWVERIKKGEEASTSVMTVRAKLRECIANDKIPKLVEWTDGFLEDTGRKLVIFAHHKIIIKMLAKHFEGRCVVIDGSTKDVDRNDAVHRFQTDDSIRVFIGSITACAESITLTAASDVCMAEHIYNPKKMEQAEDRTHRKGQTEKVTVWNLVAMGTYEEDIQDILDDKRKMVAQVVDGMSEVEAGISIEKELTYKLLDMVAERITG